MGAHQRRTCRDNAGDRWGACRTSGVHAGQMGCMQDRWGAGCTYELMLMSSVFTEGTVIDRVHGRGRVLIVKQYHFANGLISSCVGAVSLMPKSTVVE